jgi:hypothetical protein
MRRDVDGPGNVVPENVSLLMFSSQEGCGFERAAPRSWTWCAVTPPECLCSTSVSREAPGTWRLAMKGWCQRLYVYLRGSPNRPTAHCDLRRSPQVMTKKHSHRGRTDTHIIQRELMAHAIKLLGSEDRAKAMIAAGALHLLVPTERQESRSRWKPCGAFARSTGKPCQAPGNGRGGRCKLHGGMSTGPRTEQGRQRLREAMRLRWLRKHSGAR